MTPGAIKLQHLQGGKRPVFDDWQKRRQTSVGSYPDAVNTGILVCLTPELHTMPHVARLGKRYEELLDIPTSCEQFYEIVRTASFSPYGEANQREPRLDCFNLLEADPIVILSFRQRGAL